MQTLALQIQYDGTNYGGWQIQNNNNSIQAEIKSSLKKITGKDLVITGAGRTDAGVHANRQVASVKLDEFFKIPEPKIKLAINANLPPDIKVINARLLDYNFHARFDAKAREYIYYIHSIDDVFLRKYSYYFKHHFDFNVLKESAGIYIGMHNFTTFSKINTSTESYICNVETAKWEQINNYSFKFTIKSDRFVYGMVRSLVGAMLDAGRGKRTIQDLRESLNKNDRKYISPLAPAHGLFLENIYYEPAIWVFI